MYANNPFNFTALAKRFGIDPQVPHIEAPSPQPDILPQAKNAITPVLLNRFGINQIPLALQELAEQGHNQLCPENMTRLTVGIATCGKSMGAERLLESFRLRQDFKNKVFVTEVGCIGACFSEPLVNVRTPEGIHYIFSEVANTSIWPIIHAALNKQVPEGMSAVMRESQPGVLCEFNDLDFIQEINSPFVNYITPQVRRISGHCGLINPRSLPEYVATGGYFALTKALFEQNPEYVRNEILLSGLRGGDGSNFLSDDKWNFGAENSDPVRFLTANGDEGDPGSYMARALLESDPHRVIEGIALASFAIGAHQAYIFIRQEYSLAIETLQKALDDAVTKRIIGKRVLDSNYSLDISIIQSDSAFVCPPNVINNVETFANIPWIIANGSSRFLEVGNIKSPGTKTFCITGDIKRTGLIEVPLGTDSSTVIEIIGGVSSLDIKALQIGGPFGGIIPYHNFPLDYDTVSATGAMIGSGGLVVINKQCCLVALTCHIISFIADKSCKECLFCRDELLELKGLLEQLVDNRATKDLLDRILGLSQIISQTSRCNMGRCSVNSVLTSLKYFLDEYIKHINGQCPAVSCKSMINFEINQLLCKNCRCCYLVCPSSAVTLRSTKPDRYYVNNELCIRCGACSEACPFGCISPTSGGKYQWRSTSKRNQ